MSKTVLLVEDDDQIALALSIQLKHQGYQVERAADAVAGVAAAKRVHPDLMILDFKMPAGTGFSVAERVQECLPSHVPFLILTGCSDEGLAEQAMGLGAVGFFEKPYEPDVLLGIVRSAIGPAETEAAH